MLVSDIFHRTNAHIAASETVAEAIAQMRNQRLSKLIVTDTKTPSAYGLVSTTGIVHQIAAYGRSPEEFTVRDIMQPMCLAVSPNLGIEYAARLFSNNQVRHALVIDEEPLGFLSIADIFYDSDFDTNLRNPSDPAILRNFRMSRWH